MINFEYFQVATFAMSAALSVVLGLRLVKWMWRSVTKRSRVRMGI